MVLALTAGAVAVFGAVLLAMGLAFAWGFPGIVVAVALDLIVLGGVVSAARRSMTS